MSKDIRKTWRYKTRYWWYRLVYLFTPDWLLEMRREIYENEAKRRGLDP